LQNVKEVFRWNPYNVRIQKIGVSDGGAKDKKGSYGWTLNIDQRTAAEGNGPVGGDPENMHSFRTEAHGLLSMMEYIHHHVHFYHNKPTNVVTFHISSDNMGLVRRTATINEQQLQLNDTTKPDYDLVAQIQQVREKLTKQNIKVQITHVRSHQNAHRQVSELPIEEQMNVRADDLATEALQSELSKETTTKFHQFPAAKCHLQINGVPVLSNVVRPLRDAFHTQQYHKYLINNLDWSDATIKNINWQQTGRAMKTFHYNDQVRIRKLRHKWLPTNRYRHRMEAHVPNECPLCHREETQKHVFQCQHPTRKATVKKEMITLVQGLKKAGTDIQLIEIITQAVEGWLDRNTNKYNLHQCVAPHIVRTIDAQNRIGWDNFLAGFLSSNWTETIRNTTVLENKEKKPNQWYKNAFQLTCKFSINIWMARNNDMYANDGNAQMTRKMSEQYAEIQHLYTRAGILPVKYQHFTQIPIMEWQGSTESEMNAWLIQARPIIRQVEKQRKENPPHTGDIRPYGQPIR
jgi:hypothetical protein